MENTNSNPKVLKRLGTIAILLSILSLTFLIRIQGVQDIPDEQFSSNDAYVFYSQAQTISKQGHLPDRDMHRWLPNGRDNRQFLSLYAYALAWTHKAIKLFYYQVTLYHVQLYAPVICFILGLAALLLFLIKYHGHLFATVVGVLLATFPGTIVRSTAGFSDRDAWCWMLAIFTIVIYLHKERMQSGRRRYLATALCGFIVFLGGLSWEAFGIFVLIILSVEIWKFCTTDAEHNLKEYLIWVLMFVPGLYLISPAYRSGYGFSTHVATLMLAPSIALLTLRGIRWLLLRYVGQFRPHAKKLTFGLILLGIAAGMIYVVGQYNAFTTIAYPFMENRLMKSVSELIDPSFTYWVGRYGGMFILGSIGIIAAAHRYWKWNVLTLSIGLALLSTTTFLRFPLNGWISPYWCDHLFIASVLLTVIGLGIMITQKRVICQNERSLFITLVWFLIWVSLTRNGVRYGFFIGTPLAIGTAVLLKHIATFRDTDQTPIQLFGRTLHPKLVTSTLTIGMLSLLLYWGPAGGYAQGTLQMAANRDPIPGRGTLLRAFEWIKNELPKDITVMAAHWGNGSQLNVHAQVKTITDQDHFIPHWIHLYFRHASCAQSEQEALYFLKTHGATHLMITSVELAALAHQNSLVGSDPELDRHFALYEMLSLETSPEIQYSLMPQRKKGYPLTTLNRIDIVGTDLKNLSITAMFEKEEEPVQLPYVAFHGDKRISSEHANTERGGLVLLFDKKKVLRSSFYVPEVGWNSLSVKLFIRGEHSEAFELVHTVPTYGPGTHPDIQIWKINYPENIKPHPKYLATE
ncbi:hypothetical protein C6501_14910 [Candidatus Poribacteria bacterium]|nr:MAG: hypothetical protein C6501_14910 [Candidatus Poribacteria bacterium]